MCVIARPSAFLLDTRDLHEMILFNCEIADVTEDDLVIVQYQSLTVSPVSSVSFIQLAIGSQICQTRLTLDVGYSMDIRKHVNILDQVERVSRVIDNIVDLFLARILPTFISGFRYRWRKSESA